MSEEDRDTLIAKAEATIEVEQVDDDVTLLTGHVGYASIKAGVASVAGDDGYERRLKFARQFVASRMVELGWTPAAAIFWTARVEIYADQATTVITAELGGYRLHARYLSAEPESAVHALAIIDYMTRVFENDGIEICQTLDSRDVYLDMLVVKDALEAGWWIALGGKRIPLAEIEVYS
jgi:hypothetical protein